MYNANVVEPHLALETMERTIRLALADVRTVMLVLVVLVLVLVVVRVLVLPVLPVVVVAVVLIVSNLEVLPLVSYALFLHAHSLTPVGRTAGCSA
jgi:hypothetical protein